MSSNKPCVLVIEDEKQMRKLVQITLEANGYDVIEADTGETGMKQAAQYGPDLVLLDVGLPDISGIEVIRRMREWSQVPILVISASGQEQRKVQALDEGADDYLTKPFSTAELMARIRVALRHAARTETTDETIITITGESENEIEIDLVRRVVRVRSKEIHLTPIEYKLLATLAKHAGMVLTHRQLLEEVWGPGQGHQMQYLRVYMTQLRHKLEMNPARPRFLVTEPGVGYRLRLDA